MKKTTFAGFLFVMMAFGFAFICGLNFSLAQPSTQTGGVINFDTTWTKVSSPYSLVGNVSLSSGVRLTIEPGVTVNFGKYSLNVNGTLVAEGNRDEKIYLNLNGGIVNFNPSSKNWSDQTGSGCIIENAVINSTSEVAIQILGSSPKIVNSTIIGQIYIVEGSPIISYNNFFAGGSYGIRVSGGSPYLSDNIIAKYSVGIYVGPANGLIPIIGTSTIVRNTILNNTSSGIFLALESKATIKYNTITGSYTGIDGSPFYATVIYNNILNNTLNIVGIGGPSRSVVNATYNWWGTTNQTQIAGKTMGAVNYTPFLNATYNGPTEIPLPTPSQTPTPTPSITPSLAPTPTQSITPAQSNTPEQSTTPTESTSPTQSVAPTQSASINPSASPVPTPSIPEFPTWTIMPIATTMVLIAATKLRKKQK